MKKYKIENILHSKGYVSVETLIVAGIIIATGAFLISKLVWKSKDVVISSNNSVNNSGKILDDNSFDNNDAKIPGGNTNTDSGSSTKIPGGNTNIDGESSTNSITPSKDADCSLVENPSNLADFEYIEMSNDLKKLNELNIPYDISDKIKDGYSFENKIMITGYKGTSKDINIPKCINGKEVIAVGKKAFFNKGIVSIIIPDSVIVICDDAFGWNSATKLKLGKNLEYIRESAFDGNNLTELTIPDKVKAIEIFAFQYNKLEKINLNDGLKHIGGQAFFHNQLTSVIIPNTVEVLGNGAFKNNPIKNVTMYKGLYTSGEFDDTSNIKFDFTSTSWAF